MRRPAHKHLVIFARTPRLHGVKRRLGADIGAVAALRFYRRQLAALIRRLARCPRWRLWLAVTPDCDAGEDFATRNRIGVGGRRRRQPRPPRQQRPPRPRAGRSPEVEILTQGTGDLGRRMVRLLRILPPGPVVIIGSDVPAIRPIHADCAFAALGRAAAVFGPSPDGGFWLIGLDRTRAVPHGLFRAVRWSGAHALADSRNSLPPGRRIAWLDVLEDVDDGPSYRRAGGAFAGKARFHAD